jgi:hypothetical protein
VKYTALFRVPKNMYGINLRNARILAFDHLFFLNKGRWMKLRTIEDLRLNRGSN